MTPEEADRFVAGLAERVPDGPAPLSTLVTGGRIALRRRRRAALAGVVGAVVLVVGGGAVVQAVAPARSTPTAVRPPATFAPSPGPSAGVDLPAQHLPTPGAVSPGMQLVGRNRAAIEVPDTWALGAPFCATPFGPYVGVDPVGLPVATGCANIPAPGVRYVEPASVGVEATDQYLPINGIDPIRHLADGTAYEALYSCAQHGRVCRGTIAVPSQDVQFHVTQHGTGAGLRMQQIIASLRILPAGQVAVPPVEASQDATEQGLVDVGLHPSTDPGLTEGEFVHLDPPSGSVVPVGSTVRVVSGATGPMGRISGRMVLEVLSRSPIPGTVVLVGPVRDVVPTDVDGRWSVDVPPGRYRISGGSPKFDEGTIKGCFGGTATVVAGSTAHALVRCVGK